MTTLPPPSTNNFPEESLEKQVYNIVDQFQEFIPIVNDRNRLGFTLFKYLKGEGDSPEVLMKSTKIKVEGIDREVLGKKINAEIEKLKAKLGK